MPRRGAGEKRFIAFSREEVLRLPVPNRYLDVPIGRFSPEGVTVLKGACHAFSHPLPHPLVDWRVPAAERRHRPRTGCAARFQDGRSGRDDRRGQQGRPDQPLHLWAVHRAPGPLHLRRHLGGDARGSQVLLSRRQSAFGVAKDRLDQRRDHGHRGAVRGRTYAGDRGGSGDRAGSPGRRGGQGLQRIRLDQASLGGGGKRGGFARLG